MSYSIQYALSVLVAVSLAMIGAAIASADALDMTKQHVAVLGIASTGLGVLALVLPKIQKPPSDERRGMD